MSTADTLAQLHKALGDPTRRRIVNLLTHRMALCVCNIESILQDTQSKASQYLTHLKHTSVVVDERDGTWLYSPLTRHAHYRGTVQSSSRAFDEDPTALADLQRLAAAEHASDGKPLEAIRGGKR